MTEQTLPSPLVAFAPIAGVYTVPIRVFGDDRGSFAETFRREWFPFVDWTEMQTNRSISKAGVLRGLHYHLNQVDYWFLMSGKIRVGLADLRSSSPTYKAGATVEMDASSAEPFGLFIPVGVAHGFVSLSDIVLTYTVNQYYGDGRDERGVAWNDPALGVGWDVESPILSGRDQKNRLLQNIPADELPPA
ncbi:MAG: dTDP-4-dehydrorhamnose 3,5-epimerase family protein [Chloroflexota bacterium]